MKSMLVSFLLLSAGVAFGHPADPSPFPGTSALWAVPGVIHTPKMATVVMCTNVDLLSATVGMQVFDAAGASVGVTSFTLGAGATSIVSTTSFAAFMPVLSLSTTATVDVPDGTYGVLRVLSETKKLLCSAMLVDRVNNPPSATSALPIVHKLKQRGQ